MLTIAKLFGKSPFAPLRSHMDKVANCLETLPQLFQTVDEKDRQAISKKISKMEHEADLTKNDIRNHLPKSIFMPISRPHFLDILSLQDVLADKAEDIAILFTIKPLDYFEDLKGDVFAFLKKNLHVFALVNKVTKELEELLESSFGGIEAEKVKHMVEEIAHEEHLTDLMQYKLLKKLYGYGDEKLSYTSFHLWLTLFKEIGMISNLSEKLANRIRMLLELK